MVPVEGQEGSMCRKRRRGRGRDHLNIIDIMLEERLQENQLPYIFIFNLHRNHPFLPPICTPLIFQFANHPHTGTHPNSSTVSIYRHQRKYLHRVNPLPYLVGQLGERASASLSSPLLLQVPWVWSEGNSSTGTVPPQVT